MTTGKFSEWRKVRKAARESGTAHLPFPIETELSFIDAECHGLLEVAKTGNVTVEIRRRADWLLQQCTFVLCEPAPPSLVELIGVSMGMRARRNRVRSVEKYQTAVMFKAKNPRASQSAICKATGASSRVVKKWFASKEFAWAVERQCALNEKRFGG